MRPELKYCKVPKYYNQDCRQHCHYTPEKPAGSCKRNFKVKNNLSPETMKQVFDFQEPYYNLRSETSEFRRENIKTTHCGIQSVKFLGPKTWAMVKILKTGNLC